jgi:exosortase/archaeosortase family protein
MLVTFFALATGVVMVLRRPWLDKAIVVLSAAPVALAANVVRITLTGLLAETLDLDPDNDFFHNLFGLLLMPIALGMLWLELLLLARLFVEVPSQPRIPRA